MVLSIGLSRLSPWFMKLAIDGLREGLPIGRVMVYVGAMVGVALAGGVFLYLQRWLVIGASRHIEFDLRTDLFRHVQSLDMSFFGKHKTGDLMAHFTNDLNAVRDVCGPGIMYATQMVVALATSLTLMLVLSPKLTLLAFLPFPIISLVTYWFGKNMFTYSRAVQDQFGAISSRAQEDLAGLRVIRAHNQEARSGARFHDLGESYLVANMRVAKLRGVFMAAMGGLAGSGLAIALLLGGRQVIDGTLSLGSLVAFTAYLAELIWPVIAVGWVMSLLQRGASAMSRLNEVRAARPAVVSGPVQTRPAPRVVFEDVSFVYPGATAPALSNISFRLEPKQVLGVVGRTGSGKSTLIKLLLRFYDPTSGRILLDGEDLRHRDLDHVRDITGYAPQDGFLFSRTLAENIAYARPDAGRDAIERAAAFAQLTNDVRGFPAGFDTVVGERGITLSGGQRQRASLARALLVEPELLVLDDTLSSVDAQTEERILAELRRYVHGRTSIIVSHRISAVEHADWILVLEEGRVLDEGRHADLVRRDGLYARLHERQALAAEIEKTA